MKKGFVLMIVVAMVCACNNKAKNKEQAKSDTAIQEVVDTLHIPHIQFSFPEVNAFLLSQDSLYVSDRFEGGEIFMKDTFPAAPISVTRLDAFRPLLIFNSTDSMAIDIASYNFIFTKRGLQQAGPDTEVALIDFPRNIRKRILFLGSSGTVLDGKWEDDKTIMLVTAQETSEGRITPSIMRYHTDTGLYEMYDYQGTISANIHSYLEQKLNERLKTSRVS